MNKAPCRVQTLADDGTTAITFCQDCQAFHLKIGYTTLHINAEAFVVLGGTINTALARYQRQGNAADTERLVQVRGSESSLH